jgi:FMN reductase
LSADCINDPEEKSQLTALVRVPVPNSSLEKLLFLTSVRDARPVDGAPAVGDPIGVVGLGGSLRAGSNSLTALRVALDGAAAAGANTQLLAVRDLDLPLYTPEHHIPEAAHRLVEAVSGAEAMIWSSPTYQGSIGGALKNALDWLILLADHEPPYLTNKPIGLVATAGGVQGLQAINAMEFSVRALRGWAVPLVLPVAQSWRVFDPTGRLIDEAIADQLRALGTEVARAAHQFRRDGTCDYADGRQFAAPTRTEP